MKPFNAEWSLWYTLGLVKNNFVLIWTCTCSMKLCLFPACDSNVKVFFFFFFFQRRCRNKPPLFPHLYFISTAWVPSEPKLRPPASISISIACLVIAKAFHRDTPSFMQISNWLHVKMCSAIIVHQKDKKKKRKLYWVAETKLTSHEGTNGQSFKVKCGRDHPAPLWLYHSSLLWQPPHERHGRPVKAH